MEDAVIDAYDFGEYVATGRFVTLPNSTLQKAESNCLRLMISGVAEERLALITETGSPDVGILVDGKPAWRARMVNKGLVLRVDCEWAEGMEPK